MATAYANGQAARCRYAAPVRGRLTLVAVALAAALPVQAHAAVAYDTAVRISRDIGVRPAATRGERRALALVAREFATDGLQVVRQHFDVPGRGQSGNVIGVLDGPHSCLRILLAHVDSGTAGPGASDNASGTGVLIAIARRLETLAPYCDVWLVGTGAEERFVWGGAEHLGALAVVRRLRRLGLTARVRYALSLDTIGTGRRFWLRSPVPRARRGVEREVLAAAASAGVVVQWHRDDGAGNSDHREFQLAGMPGMVIEMWRGSDPCGEAACDTWRRLNARGITSVQRIAEAVIVRP
jgi:hypothetical protein